MRLTSLDVLRGLTVAGMILVNSAAGMKWGAEAEVFPLLLHANWAGLTLADLVFPGFLTMVGVAIPFSMRSGAAPGDKAGPVLWRTARLFLLGFVLSNLYWFSDFASGDWRLFGVLQRIGLVYGACALLFLTTSSRTRLVLIVAVLALYWPLSLAPALDGLPNDIWVRGHNFVASLDRVLLGVHLYVQGPEGYDPEGILGTLPAIAHGLIGVAVGEMLLRAERRNVTHLLVIGGVMIVTGLAWSWVFPIVKDIWSSPFVLVTAGITIVALAGLHAWLDRERRPAWPAAVFGAFGVNAIAAYTLHQVTSEMVTWDLFLVPFAATRTVIGDQMASLLPILLYMAFLWVCVDWLRRQSWFVKI